LFALATAAMPPAVAQIAQPAAAEDTRPSPSPPAVVRVFIEACVLTEGDQTAAVDWAISNGFDPLDVMAPNVEPLLAGKPGTALAMPQQPVWLITTKGGPCTVWVERTLGPALHLAFQQAVGQLAAKGAKAELTVERTVERAGAWRRQVQWRYRRVGGSQDFGLGAVTTLGEQPAAQALQLERMAPPTVRDPDGLPPSR
jgi:hypothetical protein